MTINYYLKNILWGLFSTSVFICGWIKDQEDFLSKPLFYILVINSFLYPFSRYANEYILSKFIKPSFFEKNFFKENPNIYKLEAVYFCINYILAIPLGLLGIIISIKNMR
ncbi:TPA: colicin transporter [Salmonella enterica]|uniref:Colicin transporter n=1 Tax=Salmonella enterica TaxID=28901 RepID=A0A757ZY95_SALER|nr:colicin transporter [Salmonella enterica]